MKKKNIGYLGLLGIPLALFGVVTSAAFAAPAPVLPATPTAVVAPSGTPAQVSATDTETKDDVSGTDADKEAPGAPETNDGPDGGSEAPGTETAD